MVIGRCSAPASAFRDDGHDVVCTRSVPWRGGSQVRSHRAVDDQETRPRQILDIDQLGYHHPTFGPAIRRPGSISISQPMGQAFCTIAP